MPISLPNYSPIVLAGVIMAVIIVLLAFVTIRQHRQIVSLQKPKYGFLGKSIYSALAILLILGFVGINFRSDNPDDGIDVNQNYNVKIVIKQQVIDKDDKLARVTLSAVPLVNGLVWGYTNNRFNLEWSITNLVTGKTTQQRELDLAVGNPGGLIVDLPLGSYSAEVKMNYLGAVFANKVYFQI